ncbi:hypothetical protein E4T39_00744 [Aureobasidium subglaciale]|nr:hypothetical protein E4T39_00744 [Aureobasidium subglaciale]
MSTHPCSRTVRCAPGQTDPAIDKQLRKNQYVIAYSVYGVPTFMHLQQRNGKRTYNIQQKSSGKTNTKLKSRSLNLQTLEPKMSDNNNNNSAQQPKQAGGFFGGLSNAAGGLASGVGGVASGTVNTVGGVVGNVGRGVGKTLSDASSGLENTAKGAGGAIGDTTGAKKQPETK